jgi:hypothetical protein
MDGTLFASMQQSRLRLRPATSFGTSSKTLSPAITCMLLLSPDANTVIVRENRI